MIIALSPCVFIDNTRMDCFREEGFSMKELLEQIMQIDHAANDRLNAAIQRKEEAMRQVDLQKEKLCQEMEEYAQKHLEDFEESQRQETQDEMGKIDAVLNEKKKMLQDRYDQKQAEWVSALFDEVVGNSASH